MSLTNPQVEKIMREYDKIRADAWADRERRIKEAYSLIPGLKETEQEIADLLFERAKGRLFRDSSEADAQRAASAGTDGSLFPPADAWKGTARPSWCSPRAAPSGGKAFPRPAGAGMR